MKTKYQKIKPKVGESLLKKTDNGWKIAGTITEVESNHVVHFRNNEGEFDVFIWIFKAGTPQEHTNNHFKWGKINGNLNLWKYA